MKIQPEAQIKLTQEIVGSTLATYGIGLMECDEVPEGISNTVVRVVDPLEQTYYLKFYKTTHDKDLVAKEVEFVGRIALLGLPVPEYIQSLDDLPVNYVGSLNGEHATTLTRSLEGSHPEDYSRRLLCELGKAHGELHMQSLLYGTSESFDPLKKYSFYTPDYSETQFRNVDGLIRHKVQELQNEWPKLPNGLVPMDIKRNNIIVKNDELVGIIDFADISMAPLVFCLAGTLWDILEATDGTLSNLEKYVESYEQHRLLNALEREMLLDITIVRGWIALHGTMLTSPDSKQAREQLSLLEGIIGKI